MQRRNFINTSFLGYIAFQFPLYSGMANVPGRTLKNSEFENLVYTLLKEWCDGMLGLQLDTPEQPDIHGALHCPACDKIHGRCMDAVYPFMYMADTTGEKKYLDAAIGVMKWSENVSMSDGSWTVMPNPKSWKGITVFGAIALGEALHYHGHILPDDIRKKWTDRLEKAANYIYRNYTMTFSHVNYGFTAVYALNLLGRILKNSYYTARSKALAKEIKNWLTTPHKLIFGEDKPNDKRSSKGLLSVDLGYNVEESLNSVVQYAIQENDNVLLELLTQSMEAHLAFMLPDGGWDNSWGTRQYKWSYWGSRTTDGCQPAFAFMSKRNPAFGTAAYVNTELLQRCTVNGLLSGGLHYASHGVKPCVHHTFAHSKSLAILLDSEENFTAINKYTPLPRSTADGIQHFPEIDVWLAARGPWRATVSSYDNIYKTEYSQSATGGSLAVLFHQDVGPLLLASMAEYVLVERYNQQPQPGKDYTLTPRIERYVNGVQYTNIQDLNAEVKQKEKNGALYFEITTALTNNKKEILPNADYYRLEYILEEEKTIIKAIRTTRVSNGDALILPIISPTGEKVTQPEPYRIEIQKAGGIVIVEANVALTIERMEKKRIFNMVPGVEALPIRAVFPNNGKEVICKITIIH